MITKAHNSLGRFVRFAFSSLASTAIDQVVAWTLFALLRDDFIEADFLRILFATCIARCVSMSVNFMINHRLVFKGDNHTPHRRKRDSLPRYFALELGVLTLSSLGVWIAHTSMGVAEWQAKPIVDFLLFFLNYAGQRKWVFVQRSPQEQPVAA